MQVHDKAGLPQLSVKAVILGVVLAMVMAGANAYLGLFAGMTVSASIPASVISMAVLRLAGGSNVLENNVVQTAASAGEALAAGVVFTLPALVLMGFWQTFDEGWVLAVAGIGGVLGVLFTVPLRRSLIIDEKLAFPEGTATAEVLKAGEGGTGVRALGYAALGGAAVKFCETGLRLWGGTAAAARFAGQGTVLYAGAALSPALLAVGYIVGLNIACLVFAGGVISWYLAIPVYSTWFLGADPALAGLAANGASAAALGNAIWDQQIRYLGVGAMLVGGIWALLAMRGSIVGGIRSGLQQHRGGSPAAGGVAEVDKDLPMKWVGLAVLILIVPLFLLYQSVTGTLAVSLPVTAVMAVTAFLFSSVAGYMAGLVGSSNNPVSGVTIATILFTALLLLGLMGPDTGAGAAAAVLVGAVVCCGAAIAGDNLQDLKAGYLLGATPWKQQVMQSVGVISGSLVMAPVLNLLLAAYGIGAVTPAHPNPLTAPQATLMASVAQGIFHGGLPWVMVGLGALIGVIVIAVDLLARARGWPWRAPVLAVAVGIYLPLDLSVTIMAGGLIAHGARRFAGGRGSEGPEGTRQGMLFAAGLITGEALLGILLAVPVVVTGEADVLSVHNLTGHLGINIANAPAGQWPGIAVMAGLCWALYRVASRSARSSPPSPSGRGPG